MMLTYGPQDEKLMFMLLLVLSFLDRTTTHQCNKVGAAELTEPMRPVENETLRQTHKATATMKNMSENMSASMTGNAMAKTR